MEYKLVLIGDKAKNAFSRNYSNDILLSGNEIGRQPPTFRDASTVATAIIESGYHFDEVNFLKILFLYFKIFFFYSLSLPISDLFYSSQFHKIFNFSRLI